MTDMFGPIPSSPPVMGRFIRPIYSPRIYFLSLSFPCTRLLIDPMSTLAGGIGTGPGVIQMEPFHSSYLDNGRRGRGFPHQYVNNRRGFGETSTSGEAKPSYAKSDRERHHDDDDDDVTPHHRMNNGDMRGGFHGNRGGGGFDGGRDMGYPPRGGFNNFRGAPQFSR